MDNQDTLSVILGACDCGSDYKSWVVVSNLWGRTMTRLFSNPKKLFGNKLVNIIEESNSLEFINSRSNGQYSQYIENITNNKYIPQSWKDKNIRKQKSRENIFITPDPSYSLEYMDKVCKETGKLFSSEKIFCRPFENECLFNNFYNELINTYELWFVTQNVFDFHHSVSVSRILSLDEVVVNIHNIPITHHGHLSDEDWVLLEGRGVSRDPKGGFYHNQIYWWSQYKTTTPEMISRLREFMFETEYWLMVCKCPNLTVDLALDILKMKNKDKFLLQILSNEFGY